MANCLRSWALTLSVALLVFVRCQAIGYYSPSGFEQTMAKVDRWACEMLRVANLSTGLCSRLMVFHREGLDSTHGSSGWTRLSRLAVIPWTLLTHTNKGIK